MKTTNYVNITPQTEVGYYDIVWTWMSARFDTTCHLWRAASFILLLLNYLTIAIRSASLTDDIVPTYI